LHASREESLKEILGGNNKHWTYSVKNDGANILPISLYVDDLLVIGNNLDQVNQFKLKMKKVFEITDLGLMTYFLGMEIVRMKYLSVRRNMQKKYLKSSRWKIARK